MAIGYGAGYPSARATMAVSASRTVGLVRTLSNTPANATAATIPTAYSAVVIPDSPKRRMRRRHCMNVVIIRSFNCVNSRYFDLVSSSHEGVRFGGTAPDSMPSRGVAHSATPKTCDRTLTTTGITPSSTNAGKKQHISGAIISTAQRPALAEASA